MVTVGCGTKHRTVARTPAPPPVIATGRAPAAPPRAADHPERAPVDVPHDAHAIWEEVGIASWYGPPYHNRRGANGEIFDMNAPTAAHRTLPLNSIVRVTNLTTGRSGVVRITDRGPFIQGRILDLSLAAARELDVWRPGIARVRLEVLQAPAAIDHGGRWCVQIGAFSNEDDATELRVRLQRRYATAKVQQFPGPTGYWLRIRVSDDDKRRAEQIAQETQVTEGGVFLTRLD